MSDTSDGAMDTDDEIAEWKSQRKTRGDKRKRKQRDLEQLSQEQIKNIIGIEDTTKKPKSDRNTTQKASTSNLNIEDKNTHSTNNKNSTENHAIPSKKNTNKNISTTPGDPTKHKNFSAKMNEIINQNYKHLFYITAAESLSRTTISDIWETEIPKSEDVIFKTKKGFLLKSNQEKNKIKDTLLKLTQNKTIINFQETTSLNRTRNNTINTNSYSAVIGSVEHEIPDKEISEFLNKMNINHRYCRRIVAKATNSPTLLIRVITGCFNSFERLLNEGIFYKHRHYPVYPSLPPAPIPQPCARCLQFTHTKEECTTPIKCTKCDGKHHVSKCDSQLPPKCTGCGAGDHSAWSLKCPKRPTKPIEGIPNTQIKSLNKRTHEIDSKITRNSKIHSPITIHDSIINSYITKLNKEKHTNREELINNLRKRFVSQYNIDTVATFSGSRLYILMFDLDQPLTISPTAPIHGNNNAQIHIDT